MRRLSLNLLTVSATVAILVLLTLPALALRKHLLEPPHLPEPDRFSFGVYIDPWHIDDWTMAVGAQPTMAAKFEAFWRKQTVTTWWQEAHRRGIRELLVSWEPWKPVPTKLGVYRQSHPQPGFRNVDIANGKQDAYIRRFAADLAQYDGTVYLRYAHEMNGFWYPWSKDAVSYRRAWRRVVRLFREADARNVRFLWSVNPNLYGTLPQLMKSVRPYWPGSAYVDAIGSTMINFGGAKVYGVGRFEPRLRALHEKYAKPVMLTEVNTQYGGRIPWLRDFGAMLQRMPWLTGVAWSQLPSRGAQQMNKPGDLNWDIQLDPAGSAALRTIIDDGLGAPRRRPATPTEVAGRAAPRTTTRTRPVPTVFCASMQTPCK
jgi:mannan endo-1,4-beta-mannosidase